MEKIDKELERFNSLLDELTQQAKKHGERKPKTEDQLTDFEIRVRDVISVSIGALNIDPRDVVITVSGKWIKVEILIT